LSVFFVCSLTGVAIGPTAISLLLQPLLEPHEELEIRKQGELDCSVS